MSERTLLISEVFPPRVGGTATWFHEIYQRYPPREVAVITDRQPGDDRSAGPAGMIVHRVPMRMADWGLCRPASLLTYLRLARVTHRVARTHGAAVIHCARVLPEGFFAYLVQAVRRLPYCVYAHGEEIGTALTSRQLTFLMRLVFRSAHRVIANSENTRSLLRYVGVPNARIVVIRPGVDVVRFCPGADPETVRARLGLAGRNVLLTVGRLQRRKGHDTVLRALPALALAVPDVHYVIVGTGEEEARLRGLADELGITKQVTFTGPVRDADLPALYQACDVFVMPNREEPGRDVEGFGIVFLEAAAIGKPVVAGRSGGVEEAVLDGKTGLLVDGTDPQAVGAAAVALLQDPVRAAEMGRLGRERAVAEFSWELVTARIRAAGHAPW